MVAPSRIWPALSLCLVLVWAPLSRAEDYSRLTDTQLRLEKENTGIGGPIALLATGGGIFLFGLPILLAGLATDQACTYSPPPQGTPCPSAGVLGVGVGFLVVGAGLGIPGGIWLGERLGKRNDIKREMIRRGITRVDLQWTPVAVPSGGGLALAGTF